MSKVWIARFAQTPFYNVCLNERGGQFHSPKWAVPETKLFKIYESLFYGDVIPWNMVSDLGSI